MPGLLALLAVVAAFLVAPSAGLAQDAGTVPLEDPAYVDLDRLIGAGLVERVLVGQRPYSGRRFAEMAAEAAVLLEGRRGRYPPSRAAYLERLVGRLSDRFGNPGAEAASGVEVSDGLLGVTWAESPPRTTPGDNGRGSIDDRVNPLLAHRAGRDLAHGTTVGAEASLRATVGRSFALEVRPRGEVVWPTDPAAGTADREEDATLRRLYARAVLGNLAVLVGRDAVVWGQGREEGLLLSTNPRPLDLVHLSNERPARLPWIFGALGPTRFSVFASDLGTDLRFRHTKLVGFRWSLRPHPRLELGFQYLNKQGGEGAPEASFGERIEDILLLPDVFDPSGDLTFSEKLIGGDLRWRLPTATAAELYLETVLTDFDVARLGQSLWLEAAYVLGLNLPLLGPTGRRWFRIELAHTGASLYRHGQFTSGLTLDGDVMGSELGSHGDAIRLGAGFETRSGQRWRVSLVAEERRNHLYDADPEPDFRVFLAEERPEERRVRLTVGWEGRAWDRSRIRLEAGAEAVDGFGFVEDESRSNAFVRLAVVPLLR